MRVFFIGTPRGNSEHGWLIYQAIVDLGYEHTSDFMIKVDSEKFYKVDDDEWSRRYQARIKEIIAADICVLEVSIHSLGVGQLLQEALRRDKPVIAFYFEGQRPQFLRGTEGVENRVQVVEYTLKDLKKVLTEALNLARELLETRFTMLMPAHLMKFLGEVSDKLGVSRSEYIRKLIEKEMKR